MAINNDYPRAERFISEKLVNSYLDSFHVYSLELQLNLRTDDGPICRSYWLSLTGDASLASDSNIRQERSEIVSNMYNLIGQRISGVKIKLDGTLTVVFGDISLVVYKSDDDLEIVWSLTPDSPEPYADHDWYVSLSDDSVLSMNFV